MHMRANAEGWRAERHGTTCFHDFVHSVRVQTIPLALRFFLLPLPPTIMGRTSSAAATVWQRRLRRRFLFEILNSLCPLNPTTLPFIPHLTILAQNLLFIFFYVKIRRCNSSSFHTSRLALLLSAPFCLLLFWYIRSFVFVRLSRRIFANIVLFSFVYLEWGGTREWTIIAHQTRGRREIRGTET